MMSALRLKQNGFHVRFEFKIRPIEHVNIFEKKRKNQF